jgi:hypothetical protein
MAFDRAARLTMSFIKDFRRRLKSQPGFMESIFGVMLEEEGPFEEPT